MSDQLKQAAAEMLPAVQQEMQQILRFNPQETPEHLFGMMQYHMGWRDEQFNPLATNTGKQIRPWLCLLACQAAGGEWRKAVPAGAAIELIHNFSLLHDDIEDHSPTRRGRATAWTIWGIPLAINAGDAMFALAHTAMLGLAEAGVPAGVVVQALRRFDQTCLELTQGQQADMLFETRAEVSVPEYLQMITGKTSVLVALAAELGSLIAGCPAEVNHHYAQFGLNLGLAFQVMDDILGIWGDEATIGKSATSDIETRKKTLPVLYGLAHSEQLKQLYQQETNPAGFVPQVVELLNGCGAREYALAQAQQYSEKSLFHLQEARPAESQLLMALTGQLLKRQS